MCYNIGQRLITSLEYEEYVIAVKIKQNNSLPLKLTSNVGVTKVRQGFSIPPNGKLGGITNKSYCFQTYGPHISSAASIKRWVSENSSAASSTISCSAHTLEL